MSGFVTTNRSPDLVELRLCLHLQLGRHPHRSRMLLTLGIQASTLDGVGRNGHELRLRSCLLSHAQVLQGVNSFDDVIKKPSLPFCIFLAFLLNFCVLRLYKCYLTIACFGIKQYKTTYNPKVLNWGSTEIAIVYV